MNSTIKELAVVHPIVILEQLDRQSYKVLSTKELTGKREVIEKVC